MVDGADTVSNIISHGDLDVAIITPVSTPGVAHDPVFQAAGAVGAVSNYDTGVVGFVTAGWMIENTAGVGLEDPAASINGNRDWLGSYSWLHALW